MKPEESQCTFWCSVLSDKIVQCRNSRFQHVSMHLLVLSAFRLPMATMLRIRKAGLNAPSGAQCFPTYDGDLQLEQIGGLNAPSGAQCFPTVRKNLSTHQWASVSMHLLVLSAFRR